MCSFSPSISPKDLATGTFKVIPKFGMIFYNPIKKFELQVNVLHKDKYKFKKVEYIFDL
jgi:hypothetical protein